MVPLGWWQLFVPKPGSSRTADDALVLELHHVAPQSERFTHRSDPVVRMDEDLIVGFPDDPELLLVQTHLDESRAVKHILRFEDTGLTGRIEHSAGAVHGSSYTTVLR